MVCVHEAVKAKAANRPVGQVSCLQCLGFRVVSFLEQKLAHGKKDSTEKQPPSARFARFALLGSAIKKKGEKIRFGGGRAQGEGQTTLLYYFTVLFIYRCHAVPSHSKDIYLAVTVFVTNPKCESFQAATLHLPIFYCRRSGKKPSNTRKWGEKHGFLYTLEYYNSFVFTGLEWFFYIKKWALFPYL